MPPPKANIGILLVRHNLAALSTAAQPAANYSTDGNITRNQSYLKKGTGGRSSFSGIVATVFGSSGFLGTYVCNKLGKIGSQLILPYRGEAQEMRPLKLVGDLGQVLFQPYHLKDEESIRKAVRYSNVVINLVGRDWETKNFKFEDVHVEGARRIARICREMGVERLIHFSALNAQPNPPSYMLNGGSKFLASKWRGEQAVREEFPDAIIFRPTDMYGQDDRFLTYFCSLLRKQVKWMPLYKKGEETIKQPVFASDVAQGVINACKDKDAIGKVFQAIGPRKYLLSELVDWFHRLMRKTDGYGYRRYDLRFDPFFQMRVTMLPYISLGFPLGDLHWERIERECHSDIVERGVPTLEDLGVNLTNMEDQVPWELRFFKAHAYYDEELGEFEIPAPPQPLPTH